jgi:alpha-mannosidase
LLARQPLRRAGLVRSWGVPGEQQTAGPVFALLNEPPRNIAVTTFKIEHEDWGQFSPFILRLYETTGQETEVTLTFAHTLLFAEETDHLERPLAEQTLDHDGRHVTLTFRPHEIKSLHMAFLVPSFAVREEGDEAFEIHVPEEADTLEGA